MDPRDEQGGAETEGDQAGGEPEPRIDAFRREDPLRGQDQEAEAEHRRGMHHRDGERRRRSPDGACRRRRSGTRRSATSRGRGRANGSAPTPIATTIISAIRPARDRNERRSRRGTHRSSVPPLALAGCAGRAWRRPDGTSGIADRTCEGRTSVGYERSRSLALSLGTSDRTIVAPSPAAVTSSPPEPVRVVAILEHEVVGSAGSTAAPSRHRESQRRQSRLPGRAARAPSSARSRAWALRRSGDAVPSAGRRRLPLRYSSSSRVDEGAVAIGIERRCSWNVGISAMSTA